MLGRISEWGVSFLLCTTLAVVGCSSKKETPGPIGIGPCQSDPPAEPCGQVCNASNPCPSGFHCASNATCNAECSTETGGCLAGQVCGPDGRCRNEGDGDGGRPDGSNPTDASCAGADVTANRTTPYVVLIVDQSGSMNASFGSTDRWTAVQQALVGNGGLVPELDDLVRFALVLYTARNGGNRPGVPGFDPCPALTSVYPTGPTDLANLGPIRDTLLGADYIEDTPTGDTIREVLDQVQAMPNPNGDPIIFILATDGEPDSCADGDPNTNAGRRAAMDLVIEQVQRAYAADIPTYLIDVGGTVVAAHKREVANAGMGIDPANTQTPAPYWNANDLDQLKAALREIVGGQLSCTLELEGRIQKLDEACSGTVRLNGRVLGCNDANGWRVVDETHIELQGSACDELKGDPDARLQAYFPCGVVVVI